MSNPRKFSEKIAMHAQKQAEGTAAFEAILKEVSATTRAAMAKRNATFQPPASSQQFNSVPNSVTQQICRLPIATSHPLVEHQPLAVYRGRSLPNVNQITTHKSIDLQKALSSLENMKHEAMGRSTSTSSRCIEKLFPRGQIERSNSHPRKHFSLTRHRDCSPYGSVYLSPPSDSSWRRVSSDSAIHSNVSGNQSRCGSKLIVNTDHVSSSDSITVNFGGLPKQPDNTQYWQVPGGSIVGRPKSCDVPGINIYPSPEQASASGVTIAVAMHQTAPTTSSGSLPNLNTGSVQLGICSPITLGEDPGGGGGLTQCGSFYLQQSTSGGRLQRQMIPAPLVLNDSNFIVMDANSLVYENAMIVSGQSQQNSPMPSATQCSFSANSPSCMVTNEVSPSFSSNIMADYLQFQASPNQLVPGLTSQQMLQYQQQQVLLQHCQLLQQQGLLYSQKQGNSSGSPPSVSSMSQSSSLSLSSPPLSSQPFLQAVLAQSQRLINHQQHSNQQQLQNCAPRAQVFPEMDYSTVSLNFSPGSAPKLDTQQPIQGHFFPMQNLSPKASVNSQNPVMHSSNVLAEAAAKQQAAVAAAVARNNSLSSAKGFVANIMPFVNNVEPQKIVNESGEQQLFHTNTLQQKFQQISVGKNMSIDCSLDGITLQPLSPPLANFVILQNPETSTWNSHSFSTSPNNNSVHNNNIVLDTIQRHCGLLSTDNSQQSFVQSQQQTRNSLSIIPDIIFTDFVGSSQQDKQDHQGNSQQLQASDECREALNALSYLSDAFEGEIFVSEDALKLALDPLEMEELQMLADSTVFTDPATEDSFRLDRP